MAALQMMKTILALLNESDRTFRYLSDARKALEEMKRELSKAEALIATSWQELLFIHDLVDKYGFRGIVFLSDTDTGIMRGSISFCLSDPL